MSQQQERPEADDGPSKPEKRRSRRDCAPEGYEWAMASLADLGSGDGETAPAELVAELWRAMDDHVGILRDEAVLREGLAELRAIRDRTADLRLEGDRTGAEFELTIDLSFMLTVAEGVIGGALERAESRGAHHRTDFPEPDPDRERNLLYRREAADMAVRSRPVVPPSDTIRRTLDAGRELDYGHLE